MKREVIIIFAGLFLSGCVSQARYNELLIQKDKAASKTIKLEDKLKALHIYQQHLQDSLSNTL